MKINSQQERMFKIAANGDSTVLITGATGTGKSTFARRIHEGSSRRSKNFVTVNLASLHEGTIESELFGHEKGAFTGADQKRFGRLQEAQGGTVFLDEIGELSPRLQARLLEFLQTHTIVSVGSSKEIKLDVRVICATHRDLISSIMKGDFREDLFHRIRVITIELVSLSRQADNFDAILHECLETVCSNAGKSVLRISEAVAKSLEEYHWPGNFRELRNVLEFAVQASEGMEITIDDLPQWFSKPVVHQRTESVSISASLNPDVMGIAEVPMRYDFQSTLSDFEKTYLEHALKKFHWRISHTARKIGLNKTTLLRRIESYKIVVQ